MNTEPTFDAVEILLTSVLRQVGHLGMVTLSVEDKLYFSALSTTLS